MTFSTAACADSPQSVNTWFSSPNDVVGRGGGGVADLSTAV